MSHMLSTPTVHQAPETLLENYIAIAAARSEPIPIESDEGKRLYRALVQHIWMVHQRPVSAGDIRDLWQRIDAVKRGQPVHYPLTGIHFWAADYANSLTPETVPLDPESNQRLAAWLDDWPNICVLGQTGRGKSSTINRLFGIKLADIGHHAACTRTVSDYRLVTGTFLSRPTGIVLWDVPGYGDERMSWEQYVKLYRRLARRCDVVVFMLDNDRNMSLDLKMFRKLRRKVPLETKLAVAVNKADLFHPTNWDDQAGAPSPDMQETISQRVAHIADMLELKQRERVVPISALKNWNIYALLNAMVDAAGESKGASLLRATRPDDSGTDGAGEKSSGEDAGARFGIGPGMLRTHFRSVIETR